MVIDQVLDIAHNLRISLMRCCRDGAQLCAFFVKRSGWLRVEDERHCQQAFDPFDLNSLAKWHKGYVVSK